MIVARLEPHGEGADRHLVGKTTSAWPLAVGTKLVLRRGHDGEWELLELGSRDTRTTEQSVLSFVLDEDAPECSNGVRPYSTMPADEQEHHGPQRSDR